MSVRPTDRPHLLRAVSILGGLALCASILLPALSFAAPPRRQQKEIRIMEHVIDDALVQSANFLVHSTENTRGILVAGYGAVFTLETSLVYPGWQTGDGWWSWDSGRARRSGRADYEWALSYQEKRYHRGRQEILELIADFGDVLTGLEDSDWLEIEARLRHAPYFHEHDLSRLTFKVRMADVRAHAAGRMDRPRLMDRIQVEES